MTEGVKYDHDKIRPSLIPPTALRLLLRGPNPYRATWVEASELFGESLDPDDENWLIAETLRQNNALLPVMFYTVVERCGIEQFVRVLEFGARKYAPHAWKLVPNARERYVDAALRHILALASGELNDPESGYSHNAHLACCIAFLFDVE